MDMTYENIWEAVAKKHNTTPNEVYEEIAKVIDIGLSDPDPKVQAEWANIKSKGDKPTPEELLAYCVKQLGSNVKIS